MQGKTYKNKALSALFLMNNVHYLVKAVESSPALAVIGEDWIELHRDQACLPLCPLCPFCPLCPLCPLTPPPPWVVLIAAPPPCPLPNCVSCSCFFPFPWANLSSLPWKTLFQALSSALSSCYLASVLSPAFTLDASVLVLHPTCGNTCRCLL